MNKKRKVLLWIYVALFLFYWSGQSETFDKFTITEAIIFTFPFVAIWLALRD
jgi:hypothetical protein